MENYPNYDSELPNIYSKVTDDISEADLDKIQDKLDAEEEANAKHREVFDGTCPECDGACFLTGGEGDCSCWTCGTKQ